uniref:G-protein coupled receptors family 3 profile domain-containing protein n=1 Tax=Panagrolaimus sp. JU765 TaxID=591449 RepID=A0AC34RD06_9BILA
MLYSHVTLLMLRVVDVVAKTTVQQSARMLVAEIPGDIQIGAMFPMHRQISGAEGCGAIWEQYGIQRAEIAMLTVAALNEQLPFRIGISIRDSCWTERIAMEQAIAFLREGVAQCSCCQTAGCQKKANPIIAIVGPAKSATTIAVQNLLQVFRIPQIAYAATTTDLSDKEQFSYFMRVVPSDVWQARAINMLLMKFNWTYIGVVYSAGNYGEKGFEAMERLSHSEVCIAYSQKVKTLGEVEEYEKVLTSLALLKPRPQVIVCFCEGASMKKIFEAQQILRKKNPKLKFFQWIGSDGWADRQDVVEGVESEAAGSFSIRIHSPKVARFEPYYFSLEPNNHTINPWFRDFWQQKFKCLLTVPKDDTVSKVCSGRENLTMGYEQDPKLSQVINSIRVVAYALKTMYDDRCKDYYNITKANVLPGTTVSPICPEMETINGTLLFRYMMNVSFVDEYQQEISFDTNGDPPAWYDVLNYVGRKGGFKLAGDFKQHRDGRHYLRLNREPKTFFDGSTAMPESVCSKPCIIGQRQRKTTACCWICENCSDNQIVNYTINVCQDCPLGLWPDINRTISKVCSGRENLTMGYEQDPKLSQVINSIRVVAYALKTMYDDRCKDYYNITKANVLPGTTVSPICPEMETINGTLLFRYMMNVSFVDEYQQEISFDTNGDPPAWYDVLNYVGRKGGFKLAGDFKQHRDGRHYLRLNREPKTFFDGSTAMPESVCSKPCIIGQRQRKTTACCWICENCSDNQIVNYTINVCQDCPLGLWPDINRTSCYALPHEYQPLSSPSSMLALVFSSLGIITTLLTIFIFLNHNSTPVVKSTTRELSYIILSGITACYLVSFAILAKPSFVSCFITRTLPPISFSVIYAALLTKTNRIARILAGSKKRILTKKPRFLSTMSQVVITWILVGIQCVIVAVGVVQEMPQAGFESHFMPRRMVLVCSSSNVAFITPFLWNIFLITLCTVYAVKTRNLPENFNEAKFIGFTMYCTLVVWVAFIVLHLGTHNKALTMSFSFSLSASIALVLLFFPKLYIILLHPEKNVRASYTTTKLIRCHFGNSQGMSDSKNMSYKNRTSSQSISLRSEHPSFRSSSGPSGPTRTASLHIVNQVTASNHAGKHDAQTQTADPGRFTRTFSVMGPARRKNLDEDVMQLIDSCRRYQDERMHSTNVQNLLLEEDVEEEDVGQILASSIETGLRTVLSTVGGRTSKLPTRETDKTEDIAFPVPQRPSIVSTNLPGNGGGRSTPNQENFEQLLRSQGVQPVQLSSATQL